jgi:hypothetical protein
MRIPDVATVNDGGTVSIFPASPPARSARASTFPVAPGAVSLAGGDLTGDGVPDSRFVDPGAIACTS